MRTIVGRVGYVSLEKIPKIVKEYMYADNVYVKIYQCVGSLDGETVYRVEQIECEKLVKKEMM